MLGLLSVLISPFSELDSPLEPKVRIGLWFSGEARSHEGRAELSLGLVGEEDSSKLG